METLMMSRRERQRVEILSRVKDGQIKLSKAAELMGVSYRQSKRLWRDYQREGDAALVHGLRGRSGNRAATASLREAVLAAYVSRYSDFGPTLASEHLAGDAGLAVPVTTLRRWLREEGLWSERRRRRTHRRRRARREHLGELVQMDGSDHDWFEGRAPRCVLMVMIDDATSRVYAQFHPAENSQAAFVTFGGYVLRYGVPQALYTDRDSIYVVNPKRAPSVEESLENTGPLTQFGQAMKQLGVRIIRAHSPQAKGRVERMNGTLQDRLVKELRLAGIDDLAAANQFLEERFLPELNRRLMVAAAQEADLHRPLQAALGQAVSLDDVLCFAEERVVQNDWCLVYEQQVLQLEQRQAVRPGQKVQVRRHLDGQLSVHHRGVELRWRAAPTRPRAAAELAKPTLVQRQTQRPRERSKPAADHPWRAPLALAAVPLHSRRSPGAPGSAPARLRSPALRQAPPARLNP